jgi:hypothetical protein
MTWQKNHGREFFSFLVIFYVFARDRDGKWLLNNTIINKKIIYIEFGLNYLSYIILSNTYYLISISLLKILFLKQITIKFFKNILS